MNLHETDLLLLAPSQVEDSGRFAALQCDPTAHAALIAEMRTMRQQLYTYDSQSPLMDRPREQQYGDIDAEAWHLIARDRVHRRVVGCIRVVFGDMRRAQDPTDAFLRMTGVEFNDPATAAIHREVIERYFAARRPTSPRFIYVGGLAVATSCQKRGLGAILGLGASALVQIIGVTEGLTVAAASNGAADLIQRIGGYMLDSRLGRFYCNHHRCEAQLLGLNTARIEQRLVATVNMLIDQLRMTPLLVANNE